jgi:hypothetical protein
LVLVIAVAKRTFGWLDKANALNQVSLSVQSGDSLATLVKAVILYPANMWSFLNV